MRRRRFKDVVRHPYANAFGAELASDEEPAPVGSILPAAHAANLDWARAYWPEIDESEIDWTPTGRRGLTVHHRETGKAYRIETGMPLANEMSSGISTWCVRDGRLVLLADKPDHVVTYHAATVTSREVTYAGPPIDGTLIQ